MKKFRWRISFGLLLTCLSFLVYLLHYALFRETYHIFKYGLHELAFVPIEVLVVTFIIDQLLKVREKRSKRYPYLFSLALRTNPFDPDASPEIKEVT